MKPIELNNFDFLCSWNDSKKEKAVVAVYFEVGSYEDEVAEGMAHFTEHMVVMGLNDYPLYSKNNMIISATTDLFATIYYIECENTQSEICKALKIAELIATGATLSKFYTDLVREDVLKEYERYITEIESVPSYILFKQFNLPFNLPIGNPNVIKNIRYDDIIQFYKKNYLTCNKKIVIVGQYEKRSRNSYQSEKNINENNKIRVWGKIGFKKYIYQNKGHSYLAWGNLFEIIPLVEKIEVILMAIQIVAKEYYNRIISSFEICSYGKSSLFILLEICRDKILYSESELIENIIGCLNENIFSLAKRHYLLKRIEQSKDILGEAQDLLFLIKNDIQIKDKKALKYILSHYDYNEFMLNVKQVFGEQAHF